MGGVVNATPHVCMKRGKGNLRDEVNITPTPTRRQTFQKVHEVLSCALFHKASATSSIVPVFVSSDKEPQREIFTYALLDTESDSSFVLEGLVKELNVTTQPLQLKLSTMTALNTIISSQNVYGLQVRSFYQGKCVQLP